MKETLTKFYKKMDDHLIQDLCEFSKENLEQKFIQSSGEIVFKFKFKTETGLFFKINELFKKNLSVCSSSFLENKDRLISLMDIPEHGLNFVIGDENVYRELKQASVVATRYNVGGKSGTIGVIGPTRMDYSHVSSQIRYVASLIGVLLGKILENY